MSMILRSALAALVLLAAPTLAKAYPLDYAIDLSFLDSGYDESPYAYSGTYLGAGRFSVDATLLRGGGNTLVSFAQVSDFSFSLPGVTIGKEDLGKGTCVTAALLPFCGLFFSGTTPLGFVGQYSIAGGGYSLRLDNTSGGLFDPSPGFNTVSFDDLDPRFNVSVAVADVSLRPVPEPSSIAVLGIGALVLGFAWRRSVRRRVPAVQD
jgi:hypothetical protein